MERQRLPRRNIILLRIIRSSLFFMPMIPVLVVYYKQNGMNQTQVMLLQAIFSVAMLVFEIPSGYFSDVLGRRRTMIIGCSVICMGMMVYCFAYGFSGFLLAELILGVGLAFISGTDSAMLYDSLLELGNQHHGIKEEGRQLSFGHYAEAASGLIGGFIAVLSIKYTIYLESVVYLTMIPAALMLTEPAEHRRDGKKASFGEIIHIVTRMVHRDRYAKWMIITSSILGCSTLTFVWLFQPYLVQAGVHIGLFGAIWATVMIITAGGSQMAHRLHARFSTLTIVTGLASLVVTAYLILGSISAWYLVPVFGFFYITRGVSNPLFTTGLNQRSEAHERGTVLSIRQLGVRLLFAMFGPLVGFIADSYSLGTALLASGVLFGSALVVSIIFWRRADRGENVVPELNVEATS